MGLYNIMFYDKFEEENSKIKYRRKRSVVETAKFSMATLYHRIGLKHVLPVLILIGYSFLGAVIFMLCERSEDVDRRRAYRAFLIESRDDFIGRLHSLRNLYYSNTSDQTFTTPTNIAEGFSTANEAFVQYLSGKFLKTLFPKIIHVQRCLILITPV